MGGITIETIILDKANSHETYFTLHNIKAAHAITLEKGVKVGVIDWLFAYADNTSLYSGFADIAQNPMYLNQSGHGYWMANTLHEIAPGCEICAINAVEYGDNANRIGLIEKAVEWAIDNGIDVLTYSHPAFAGDDKRRADAAIEKAANVGIITTFINCDSPHNIWPYGCFPFMQSEKFCRVPDMNVLHFDYSVFRTDVYERYKSFINTGKPIRSGDDVPFFSFSSMSPVLGGFVALLKELKRDLTVDECRRILIDSSYTIIEQGKNRYDINPCDKVVDIGKAVTMI